MYIAQIKKGKKTSTLDINLRKKTTQQDFVHKHRNRNKQSTKTEQKILSQQNELFDIGLPDHEQVIKSMTNMDLKSLKVFTVQASDVY